MSGDEPICGEENQEFSDYPVRYVSVNFGNSEDGGGVSVVIRADGVPVEELVKQAKDLLSWIFGKEKGRPEDVDVV